MKILDGVLRDIASDGCHNAFPGIGLFPDGRLLIAYRSGPEHMGIGRILARLSGNLGETWGPAFPISDEPVDCRDPSVSVLRDGTIHVSYFVYPNLEIRVATYENGQWLQSHALAASGATSGPMVQTADRTFLPVYRGNPFSAYLLTSYGETVPVALGENYSEMTVAHRDHDLLAMIRKDDTSIYSSTSPDGWEWSTPFNRFPGGGRPFVLKTPDGFVCIYRAGAVFMRQSPDGESWGPPEAVDTRGMSCYAAATMLPDGRAAVAYSIQTGPRADVIMIYLMP